VQLIVCPVFPAFHAGLFSDALSALTYSDNSLSGHYPDVKHLDNKVKGRALKMRRE
jgi:hypothetical protein